MTDATGPDELRADIQSLADGDADAFTKKRALAAADAWELDLACHKSFVEHHESVDEQCLDLSKRLEAAVAERAELVALASATACYHTITEFLEVWNKRAALAQTEEENVAVLYPMGTDILRTRVCPECESVITSGINRCPHCSGE